MYISIYIYIYIFGSSTETLPSFQRHPSTADTVGAAMLTQDVDKRRQHFTWNRWKHGMEMLYMKGYDRHAMIVNVNTYDVIYIYIYDI